MFMLVENRGRIMKITGLTSKMKAGEASSCETLEPGGFSRVAAGFSSYDWDFRLPLALKKQGGKKLAFRSKKVF